MPTDEQRMRDAFEDIRVAEYDILSVDRDPETGEYARRSTYEAWGNFIGGWLARDAEVQALRDENRQYFDLLLVVALANDGHGWLNQDVSDRIDSAIGWDEKENPDD